MTAIIGCVGCALALLLSHLGMQVGVAMSLRAHAQAAADSAALAAVAESGPYGDGDHEGTAERFARANGGELIECLCEPGATAVEVEVAVGDVTARARAVLDVRLLAPSAPSAVTTGFPRCWPKPYRD